NLLLGRLLRCELVSLAIVDVLLECLVLLAAAEAGVVRVPRVVGVEGLAAVAAGDHDHPRLVLHQVRRHAVAGATALAARHPGPVHAAAGVSGSGAGSGSGSGAGVMVMVGSGGVGAAIWASTPSWPRCGTSVPSAVT